MNLNVESKCKLFHQKLIAVASFVQNTKNYTVDLRFSSEKQSIEPQLVVFARANSDVIIEKKEVNSELK